jgi:hypothetical protein
MLAKIAELDSRLSKYEEADGLNASDDVKKDAPKATDPNTEPAVEDPEDTKLDDAPDADPADPEKSDDDDKKKTDMSRKSNKPTRADIIALAAKFGMRLAPAATVEPVKAVKKTFEILVDEKMKALGGIEKKNEAITFCIKNHKPEYTEYRKAFISTGSKTKTL